MFHFRLTHSNQCSKWDGMRRYAIPALLGVCQTIPALFCEQISIPVWRYAFLSKNYAVHLLGNCYFVRLKWKANSCHNVIYRYRFIYGFNFQISTQQTPCNADTSLLTHAIAKVRVFTSLFSEGIPAHTMKNWNTKWYEMRWTWITWSWFKVPVKVKLMRTFSQTLPSQIT